MSRERPRQIYTSSVRRGAGRLVVRAALTLLVLALVIAVFIAFA